MVLYVRLRRCGIVVTTQPTRATLSFHIVSCSDQRVSSSIYSAVNSVKQINFIFFMKSSKGIGTNIRYLYHVGELTIYEKRSFHYMSYVSVKGAGLVKIFHMLFYAGVYGIVVILNQNTLLLVVLDSTHCL